MSTKVTDPNAKSNAGFLWGLGVLLVIVAAVIGYIVWNGQGAKTQHLAERQVTEVKMNMEYDNGSVKLTSDKATKDTPTVELFEDFSCPHCGDLGKATDADMKKAIEEGKLNVTIRALNFLDGQDLENQEGHSTRAAAAAHAVAQAGDVQTYWNLRDVLMQEQKDIYNKWTMDDFANAAKELGASDDVVNAVKNADIKELGNTPAAASAKELQEETGELSSPRIIYQDKDLIGDNDDIMKWIEKAEALKA